MSDITQAVACLNEGGIIACPTEAVYGLSCDPANVKAVKRLLALKARDKNKGLILVASDLAQLLPYLAPISDDIQKRISPTWPGPCTWVLPAKKEVSTYLTGKFSSIALRVTNHPVLKDICDVFNGPIVSTSANLAGERPCVSYDEACEVFSEKIAFIFNGNVGDLQNPTPIFDGLSGVQLR